MHDTSHATTNQWSGILPLTLRSEGTILIPNAEMSNYMMSKQELMNALPALTLINYSASRI